jgi:hypothetical protein
MAVADVHPSVEELTAFTLGTLDEETQASIEAHVFAAVAGTEALSPAIAASTPAELNCPEVADALPPELSRHERYRIMRLLGVGGMGAVYEAEHRVLHQPRALKVITRPADS